MPSERNSAYLAKFVQEKGIYAVTMSVDLVNTGLANDVYLRMLLQNFCQLFHRQRRIVVQNLALLISGKGYRLILSHSQIIGCRVIEE